MTASEETRIAVEFVERVGTGGIDERHYAADLTAWSPLMGMITREQYLPKLSSVKEVWREPLSVTIDTVTAQPGRVAVQARSHGVLIDGQAYGNTYLFLIEFNDAGQIRHVREYFNPDPVREILQPVVFRWRAENGVAG
jgi:ketosteroid isomerase-like protein